MSNSTPRRDEAQFPSGLEHLGSLGRAIDIAEDLPLKDLHALEASVESMIRERYVRPAGAVYVLRAGDYFKVGRSSRPCRRVRTLKIQLPFAVDVYAAFPCEDPVAAEAELHERFADYRANGEWFTPPERHVQVLTRVAWSRGSGGDVKLIASERPKYMAFAEEWEEHERVCSDLVRGREE